MKKVLTIITVIFVLVACAGQAQINNALESLELEQFTLPSGKYGNHVQAIAQDDYGFMWFGTQYGLHRWDGHRFKTYVHATWDGASISSNYIECIYVAKDGSLWIGTWGSGLNHFQHELDKFTKYRHTDSNENSLPNDFISDITEDNDGNLWIATQNGLSRMNLATGKIKNFTAKILDKNSIDCNSVRKLFVDSKGTLWIGTGFPFSDKEEGALLRYNPENESFTKFAHDKKTPSSLSGYFVKSIFEDRSKRLWVGSSGGLQLFNRESEKFTPAPINIDLGDSGKGKYQHVTFFLEDNKRRYWAGHFTNGIYCIDPVTNSMVGFNDADETPQKRKLLENAGWNIFQSKDGIIWLSTASDNGRLYRIVEPSVAAQDIEQLPAKNILVEGKPSSLADRLRDTTHSQFVTEQSSLPDPDSIPDVTQNEVWQTKKGDKPALLLTNDNGDSWIRKNLEEGELIKLNIYSGGGEVFMCNPPSVLKLEWKSNPIKDKKEDYWVCLENGLLQLDAGQKKGFFVDAKSLSGKPPFKGMVMDKQGDLWILGQSLLKFEPDTKRSFSFENRATAINLPEAADNIYTNEQGEIVLQNDEGTYPFSPDSWKDSLNAPILRITDFELLDTEVQAAFDSSQQASFWETNVLELEHYQNAFFFRFAVMDFKSPELHKLEYMLENHDKNWRIAEGDPRAIYANVPPGLYTFKVRGANQFGIWGDEASLIVFVHKPWWATCLAQVLYLLLAVLFIYYGYQFLLKRRLAENETLRLKELHETKSRLYTNITHEFRTPLTVIMGMAKQIQENPKANLKSGLDLINRNGEQLLGLVTQLLDLSKLEGGKMKCKTVQADVVEFLNNYIEGMKSYARDKGVGLHFLPDAEQLTMDFDPDKLQQVVGNILSNAIKFTPSTGHVYVNLNTNERDPISTNRRIALKIRDTGKGIPAKELKHIFDRFYQVDGSSTRQGEGSGIGLSLSKELVELMGGEIKVNSWEGAGSEFTVFLPVGKKSTPQLTAASVVQQKELPTVQSSLPINTANGDRTPLPIESIVEENSPPTLLLIEDNPDVVAYLASCLQDQYSLLVGKDGQEGVEIAFDRIPDLIITDVMMPHKDGFEVSNILKNDERTSHIPIIMLTAKADMASKLEGLQQGVDAYLSKPFHKEELLIRLEKLLQLRKRLQQHYQSVAGLSPIATPTLKEDYPLQEKATEQEDYFVIKVRRSVESHLDDFEFNVEKLCRDVGMSHSQLHRKLSALTGLSSNQFIRNIRLGKAKELLRQQPQLTITAVAMDVGFSDPGYFGRVFKKEFGVTPLEWQEEAGTRI